MTAWRLVKARYANDPFSGEGSRRFGGRWNFPGTAVVYASESRALAALEVLVHVKDVALLSSYVLAGIEFSEDDVFSIDKNRLPLNWREPVPCRATRVIGHEWTEDAFQPVMEAPSVILPAERNFVFNPAHPRFREMRMVKAEPFEFDVRF